MPEIGMPGSDERTGGGAEQPTVLIFCPDVMFASRIQNLARHAGVRSAMVRPGQSARGGELLVASFGSGAGWEQAIAEAAEAGIPVIAFGPHVDSESRRAAKAAGALRVLANGNLDRALLPVLNEMAAGGAGMRGALAALPGDEAQEAHEH
jgi:hypothetical protein